MSPRKRDANTPAYREYIVYAALENGEVVPAAELLLETDARGRHRTSGLEYRESWIDTESAFALDPVHAPLAKRQHEWSTRGQAPGIIDEVLPGAWERALLQRAWEAAGEQRDPGDLHAVLGDRQLTLRVGATAIVSASAAFSDDLRLSSGLDLADLEAAASQADEVIEQTPLELDVLRRLRAGTTVGGARPKILVHDQGREYIAKFTRRDDPFNHARVEHACLELARRAGLAVPHSRLVGAGADVCLLVERFDVTPAGGRRQLLSANALLKDPDTCEDAQQASYEDLVDLICRWSDEPADDVQQLYAQMLFNEAINNRDDHLRNFSFLRTEGRLHLSPAYDLVPTDALGAYPVLGFNRRPTLPRPTTRAAHEAARVFRLQASEARRINERFAEAFTGLEAVLDAAGVSERDRRVLQRVLWSGSTPTAR